MCSLVRRVLVFVSVELLVALATVSCIGRFLLFFWVFVLLLDTAGAIVHDVIHGWAALILVPATLVAFLGDRGQGRNRDVS